jgi:hypothetical protein
MEVAPSVTCARLRPWPWQGAVLASKRCSAPHHRALHDRQSNSVRLARASLPWESGNQCFARNSSLRESTGQ